jgi:hypothetical protein
MYPEQRCSGTGGFGGATVISGSEQAFSNNTPATKPRNSFRLVTHTIVREGKISKTFAARNVYRAKGRINLNMILA